MNNADRRSTERQDAVNLLVTLVRDYAQQIGGGHPLSLSDDDEEAKRMVRQIRLVAWGAVFIGGFGALRELHDAAESTVGNDNSIGFYLNHLWDGIGGWLA